MALLKSANGRNSYSFFSSPRLAFFATCSASKTVKSSCSFSLLIIPNTEEKVQTLTEQPKYNQRIWHLGHSTNRTTFFNLYSKSISFSSSIFGTEKKKQNTK